ncbi:MAG TPA: polyprenyl synthetase family protein [Candidatus Thermoplasmatota archaeon]|nr:polyprenyl synthetase family protein [Candidatus Thermoplasmatota archaeon]
MAQPPATAARAHHAATVDVDAWMARVEATMAEAVSRTEDPLLSEMALKMVRAGGKRLRPRVGLLAYAACGGTELTDKVRLAAAGIELVHTATLIHDDIIDGGDRRRGVPATHREYGLERAILAGDFLFVKGFELSGSVLDARIIELTAGASTWLAEGELLEHRHLRDLSIGLDRYVEIVAKKTAAPIEKACQIGAYLAGADAATTDAFARFGRALGIAFQMSDDLLDVRGNATGKPRGVDLRGGVPTLPSLLTIRAGNQRFRVLVEKAVKSEEDVRELIDTILASGSLGEAERIVDAYAGQAAAAVAHVPDSPYKRELLALCESVARRDA